MSMRRTQRDILVRFFGDLPVIEAKGKLIVLANDNDGQRAVRADPANCVFAKACHRLYGSTAVVFFRSVAYIDLPDAHNVRHIHRFMLPHETRDKIAEFDRTGVAATGGYTLLPPTRSATLEAAEKYQRRHRDRPPLTGPLRMLVH